MSADKTFFMSLGVPDSLGISHPKSHPFYVSATNPNTSGGCLCERHAQPGPFVVFPGDMLDVSSPRPVLCAGCVPLIEAVLEGSPVPDLPVVVIPPENVVELVADEDEAVVGL
jgi:hypothetical protein